jgi:hypothetical protein
MPYFDNDKMFKLLMKPSKAKIAMDSLFMCYIKFRNVGQSWLPYKWVFDCFLVATWFHELV